MGAAGEGAGLEGAVAEGRKITKRLSLISDTNFRRTCGFVTIQLDGWMTWDFTSFSTVFQSYQNDDRSIMKCCV